MNCSTQHRFLLLIFFIRYVGGEGRRKRRHEKSHDAAHLQNRRWGALYLKFCSPTLCPNNGMAAVRSNKFLQPPPPPPKRGKNCPPHPDVTFLQPYNVYPGSYNSTLVHANSLYICKSLDRKNSRFSLNPYYLVFLVRAIRDFALHDDTDILDKHNAYSFLVPGLNQGFNLYSIQFIYKTSINPVRLLMNIGHLTGIRTEWKSLQHIYMYAKSTPLNRSKLGLQTYRKINFIF